LTVGGHPVANSQLADEPERVAGPRALSVDGERARSQLDQRGVGVGAGIALTAALASAGLSAWWLMPALVVATLFASLWRATGRQA
jgi:hypothetical protein